MKTLPELLAGAPAFPDLPREGRVRWLSFLGDLDGRRPSADGDTSLCVYRGVLAVARLGKQSVEVYDTLGWHQLRRIHVRNMAGARDSFGQHIDRWKAAVDARLGKLP